MTTSSIDTSCQVTNNAGTPVVVLDAFKSATYVANNSPQRGYQQSLKILPLADGSQTIADGATGTVTLNDTRTNAQGQTLPNYLYQLLISQPQSLFPVMNVGEAVSFATSPMSYPPIIVTAAAAKNMKLAFAFCQNIMAYPGSNLAKNFLTAMTNAQGQSSVTAMMQAIADYFNTTKGFQGLDFPSYLAVSTYIKSFAWVWGLDANGNPGRTYYLYSSASAGGQSSGSSSQTTEGSIAIQLKSSAPNPADPTDPNSGYTITFTPSSGDPITLNFSNGQFVNDTSADVPPICLQGGYALKSVFTQNSSDNVLWPILVGNVNGTQVIGVSQAPEGSDGAFMTWLKSLVPKSFDDALNSFLKIMGVVMALDFIKTKLAGKKEKLEDDKANENGGADPNPQQQADADAAADQVGNNAQADQQGAAGHMGNGPDGQPNIDVPAEAALPQAQAAANDAYVDAVNEAQGDALQGSINEYDGQVKQLAEIEVNPQLEDAMGNLVDANQNLPDARQSGDFSDINASLADAKTNVNAAMENMDVSAEVQQQIEDSQAAAAEYEESADDLNDEAESTSGGDEEFEPEVPEV